LPSGRRAISTRPSTSIKATATTRTVGRAGVSDTAANLRLILNSFQETGWRDSIYDPFPPDHEATDPRRRAVATLNQGLTGIRFLCEGHGRKISWEAVDGEPADEKAKQS
jgi:hypothetical protein